jgi:hypothetical protein
MPTTCRAHLTLLGNITGYAVLPRLVFYILGHTPCSALKTTGVSGDHVAYSFRVEEYINQEISMK